MPVDTAFEVHLYSADTIHLFLPSTAPTLVVDAGKIHLSDSDLMSGTAFAKLASDKKKDGNDGKAKSDSDDVRDQGGWTDDDRGDGATDIGDRRRRKDTD